MPLNLMLVVAVCATGLSSGLLIFRFHLRAHNQMTMELDLDGVLDLEQEAYQRGYDEGVGELRKQNYVEGKQYGYQTGFQRFVIIGYLRGLVTRWQGNDKVKPHVDKLEQLLNAITTGNDEKAVQLYEDNLNKARNKARVVALILGEPALVAGLDEMIRAVCGDLKLQQDPDDMW